MTKLNDIKIDFDENTDGLIIKKEQLIPHAYLKQLQEQRLNSVNQREGEMMRVASIPVCIVEKWVKEGFDFWNESAQKILAKLKHENLEYFITTAKQI